MDQVQNESCIQCDFRTLPKRIVLLCALWCSILDKVIHQLHHILIILDVGKGIEAVRAGWLDQVKHLDSIAPFEQQRRYGPERFPLGVSHKKATICLHQIWLNKKPRLACAGAADDDLQQIAPVHFPVQAHADILCQDGVVVRVFVPVFGVQPFGAAPFGRTVLLARPAVLAGGEIKRHGKAIGRQRPQHKFRRMQRPPHRKGMLHQPRKPPHQCRHGHSGLILCCKQRCQPKHHRHRQ